MLLTAVVLTACKGKNEAEQPIVEGEGQEITLCFSIDNTLSLDEHAAGEPSAPMRKLPGDPGKDDFIVPTHLYFAVWVTTGGNKYMKTCHIDNAAWAHVGNGIYQHGTTYKLKLPSRELTDGMFHVFAYATSVPMTTTPAFNGTYTEGETIMETTTTLETLRNMTYAIPGDVGTQDAKRDFFRSIYSTALSHNQMATSPTIRLRHTAARLDINWECDETTHEHGLTPNSTWTLATAAFPTAFSLFKPGENTGTAAWSETITINEGNRYNGRYVTYLPMPTTPTFTVTSNRDNLDGASASKTMELSAGADTNFATWMRALWTIK